MRKIVSSARKTAWLLTVVATCLFAFAGSARAQSGQLISADYGTGDNRVDVTSRLQSMSQNGYINFQVSNDNLGGDPVPNQPKELRVRLRDNSGRTRDYRFHEGDTVSLTLDTGGYNNNAGYNQGSNQGYDPNGNRGTYGQSTGRYRNARVRIISARYGAGNSWRNVTSRVQRLVRTNNTTVKVNNTNLGGDPAEGEHKWLEVVYESRGQRQDARFAEGDYINFNSLNGGTGGYRNGDPDGDGDRDRNAGGYNRGGYGNYSGLRITSARYGAGDRWMDVTGIVQSQVTGNSINIKVNNTNMGGDPAENQPKWLEVEWDSSTGHQSTRIQEGGYLNISDTGANNSGGYGNNTGTYGNPGTYGGGYAGLRIISARYGAGNQWMDVTSTLQNFVSGGSINVKVNNTNMGGDPAVEQHKVLEVQYQSQSGIQTTTIAEGDYLNLSPR